MREHSDGNNQRQARKSTLYPQFIGLTLALSLILTVIGVASWHRGDNSEPLEPILLATGEWVPYSGERLANFGVASAVVSIVFRQMGYEPKLRILPWPRAEQSALENETRHGVRATFPYAFNVERGARFYYSKPIFDIQLAVFYNAKRTPGAANIRTTADLAEFFILPISGYRYPAAVEKFLGNTPAAENNVSAFKALLDSDKPLLVFESTEVGKEILRESLALEDNLIAIAPLRISSPIHLIASKRNPDNSRLIRQFDETLEKMRQDGSLNQLKAQVLEAIDVQRAVHLQPLEPQRGIEAFVSADKSASVLLPQGSRVVIERWSSNYLQAKAVRAQTGELVKVRVLNGPQRGRILYVDERAVALP